MSKTWDEMRKAKEESYFDKKNREALERLAAKSAQEQPRLSPITGEPMEQVVLHGVVIDRCRTSGGIWLDKGELEQLLAASGKEDEGKNWISGFFRAVTGGTE